MVMKWIRENVYASAILAIVRLYLGWKWLDAGWHKITGDGFDASGFLKKAIEKPLTDSGTKELLYPNFTNFIDSFALPNVKLINVLIPWGEFLIGLGLILGVFTTAAAFFGLMLNFMFMFSGTVSTNPWLTLFGFIILIAGANAGRFGGDRFVLPYVRKWLKLDRIGAGTDLKG
ncbi:DoxX family protein [Paenibacillus contaminans]|uniref:Crp/Fnr family transcriptional regulator n=1 Tax=Paenibacillus contaminans TaxID=450362 RepID=A0A329MKR7_9BACL|nr:DoxX family protein [Paenibacillus contaminans]RAV20384.1 Crp/Fnr family transcriptional regulator [Paenibacillus contaminans]